MRSPPIDLTAAGPAEAILSFQQFRDADGFGDTGIVRILSASDLSELGTFDPDLTQFDIDWNEFTIPLPGTAIGQSIIIEFKFTSDNSADNFSGWSIDNVEINLQ